MLFSLKGILKKVVLMKKIQNIATILLFMISSSVFAHHPAADMVDEDVYEMIDEMVADTPHADMTFDDMDDVTETTITSSSIVTLDRLLDDGLVSYVGMLDGDVSVSIDFNDDGSATTTITQTLVE